MDESIEGPQQVHVPCDFRVALETVFRILRAVLLYIFMIDTTYWYHRESDSPSVGPYNYVPFQIQDTLKHEDIAFHENAMGPM